LNPFIKQFCDRLAREGFVVLAPDLFYGAVGTTKEEAERISSRFETDRATTDRLAERIKQAAALLQTIGGPNGHEIGVVAFSFGGYWTIWLANQKDNPVAAAVLFYATGEGDFANSHGAFQFHLAETDPYEPPANAERVRRSLDAAGKQAKFYTYPGTTHWFFESDRPDAFNADAAELAWTRTVEFLRAHIPQT
jgi:carboxymethylenebutenolidase